MDTFDYPRAQRMVRDYVCSHCWGVLSMFPGPERTFYVKCADCKDETPGYVTKHYVEQSKANSNQDMRDATKTLQEVGILPKPEKKSTEDLIKDLGF